MRLLHTSDWHLGQTLQNFDRTAEHQQFLDWLLDTLAAENVDALVIAGDIFETANPSAAAQSQLYTFLAKARERVPHLAIALIAGNHDSPGRLEALKPFLGLLNASVIGSVPRLSGGGVDAEGLVVPLKRGDGSVAAWCLSIPYLRPGDVPRVAVDSAGVEHSVGFAQGVEVLYRQAYEAALLRREPGQPIIAMGHCHMVGGDVSDESERSIIIGGAEALSAELFHPDIAYVALGHLHRPQQVGGKEHIRYSGSPLPMSFAEINYPHQVVVVDFEGERHAEIRSIRVPRPAEFLRVPAEPKPIEETIRALRSLEVSAGPAPYLEVLVRLDGPEPGLRAKIDEALEGKNVRLVKITPSRTKIATDGNESPHLSVEDLKKLSPQSVFERVCDLRDVSEEKRAPLNKLLEEMILAAQDVEAHS